MTYLTLIFRERFYFYKMEEENVILVDESDVQIGLMPKMEAHEKALLHRAFSVFIMNDKGETMIQQRAGHKYHSPFCGQIPVVVIRGRGNPIFRQGKED